MLLENKHAVIYGAGGPIGAAVARALAREGARVSLAGRTRAKLDELAREMATASGDARRRRSSMAPWRRLGNFMPHSGTAIVSTPTRVWTV